MLSVSVASLRCSPSLSLPIVCQIPNTPPLFHWHRPKMSSPHFWVQVKLSTPPSVSCVSCANSFWPRAAIRSRTFFRHCSTATPSEFWLMDVVAACQVRQNQTLQIHCPGLRPSVRECWGLSGSTNKNGNWWNTLLWTCTWLLKIILHHHWTTGAVR